MLTQEQLTMMAENVARIRENMAAAAREAGRDPADILLCAACKTRTVEEVIASAVLPIDLFGENHVQELVERPTPTLIAVSRGILSAICRPTRSTKWWAVLL